MQAKRATGQIEHRTYHRRALRVDGRVAPLEGDRRLLLVQCDLALELRPILRYFLHTDALLHLIGEPLLQLRRALHLNANEGQTFN